MEMAEKVMEIIKNIAEENYLWNRNSEIYELDNEIFVSLEAGNHATVNVYFDLDICEDSESDINLLAYIIYEIIHKLRKFDADDEFEQLWSVEFGKHNNFKPSEFLNMLQEDEEEFESTADKLETEYSKLREALNLVEFYIKK